MRAVPTLALVLTGLLSAGGAMAQPNARGTSAGVVLQQGEQGIKPGSPAATTIGRNEAAGNYPTVDTAFAHSDGIGVPVSNDQSPGQSRRANDSLENALLTSGGAVRMKRMLGAGVFNGTGERLGSVREIMLSGTGEPQVIVEADGRQVEIPWNKLSFHDPGEELHGKVVLPGATPHGLAELPEFKPAAASGNG